MLLSLRVRPLPPLLKTSLALASYTLGLALAVYLAALRLFALPCIGPGDCQSIVYSAYGSVAGLPVSVIGSALWIAAFAVRDTSKRAALLFLLAAGAAVFMVIQFAILRGFCLYCTLHAIAAWGALLLHHERPRLWVMPLALLIAAGGFFATKQAIATKALPAAEFTPKLATLAGEPSSLAWLGPIHPRSPALVLSLDCPACLDLLDSLSRQGTGRHESGPAVYLKTNDTNYTLSVVFTAAMLSQKNLGKRDAFLAIVSTLLSDKTLTLSDPEAAALRLAALFPDAAAHQADAKVVLAAQAKTLEAAGLGQATPLLITRDGRAHPYFAPSELFP